MMRIRMWMFLAFLCVFIKGVSFSNNCSVIRVISSVPGEPFTLDVDEDGVEESILVDDSGTDIARINKSGALTVLDKRYKDKISAKGFSFHVQDATIKDQMNFTLSVLYKNGSHCSQHYLVKKKEKSKLEDEGPPNCHEKTQTVYIQPDHSFTLGFESAEVDEITWVDTKAVTKAKLQILDNDYEGNFSLIGVILRKSNATPTDKEHYTGIVSFRNGTQCLQHYLVTRPDFEWYAWIILTLFALAFTISSYCFIGLYEKKRNDLLKERNKSKKKEKKTLI